MTQRKHSNIRDLEYASGRHSLIQSSSVLLKLKLLGTEVIKVSIIKRWNFGTKNGNPNGSLFSLI